MRSDSFIVQQANNPWAVLYENFWVFKHFIVFPKEALWQRCKVLPIDRNNDCRARNNIVQHPIKATKAPIERHPIHFSRFITNDSDRVSERIQYLN